MSEAVRKGKVLGTVLWYALMGIPVAAGGYLIYSKQHALGVDDAPPSAAAVAAAQLEAPTTVAVAPRYADPEMLRQKEAQDALLRRDFELRLAKERESLGAGSGPSTRPAKGRVITLGPSANPEKPVEQDPNAAYERAAADANAAREEAARKARGPQMHEVAEDHRDSERRREAELRQQGVQVNSTRGGETPLLPFSGTSTGSYGSSNSRSRSPSRR